MRNTRNFSQDVKNLRLWFVIILIGSGLLSLALSGETLLLIFYTEGQGIVVNKMNRSGAGSGLWITVEDGTETRIPFSLWDTIDKGDFLLKKRFSYIYQINEKDYNSFLSMMKGVLIIWGVLFVLYLIGFLHKGLQHET